MNNPISFSWFLLVVAGLFEVGWAVGLKDTDGFTRLVPTALVIVMLRILSILLIIAGIAGLKLVTPA